jgi:hypothetical protein
MIEQLIERLVDAGVQLVERAAVVNAGISRGRAWQSPVPGTDDDAHEHW